MGWFFTIALVVAGFFLLTWVFGLLPDSVKSMIGDALRFLLKGE